MICSADNSEDKKDCRHAEIKDLNDIKCGTCESIGYSNESPCCGPWLGAGEAEFIKDMDKRLDCCPIATAIYPHPKPHHIWCSYQSGPVEECKLCQRLYKEYPMDGLTPDELQEKYFPNVIKRT